LKLQNFPGTLMFQPIGRSVPSILTWLISMDHQYHGVLRTRVLTR